MNTTAVLLINVGTPQSPKVTDVRRFLREFLTDKHVISIPSVVRYPLVYGIITPFRAPKSAALYQKIWSSEGSPLIVNARKMTLKLQKAMGEDHKVFLGMRYGEPSLEKALSSICEQNFDRVVVLPLFPQYASSTSGTAIEFVQQFFLKKKSSFAGELSIIEQFYNHKDYIQAWVNKLRKYDLNSYDHILFSYHGLPLSHVRSAHSGKRCEEVGCMQQVNEQNPYCYQATVYANTRLIAQALDLNSKRYTVCFQSRFSKNWLSPFTDDQIEHLAKNGAKRILVVSPSFVNDCLETLYELGIEYRDLFYQKGGEHWDWVSSLNDDDLWIAALKNIILDQQE